MIKLIKNKIKSIRNAEYVNLCKVTSGTVYPMTKEQCVHSLLSLFKYSVFHFHLTLIGILAARIFVVPKEARKGHWVTGDWSYR